MNKYRNFEYRNTYEVGFDNIVWSAEELDNFEKLKEQFREKDGSLQENWRYRAFKLHQLKSYDELEGVEKVCVDSLIERIHNGDTVSDIVLSVPSLNESDILDAYEIARSIFMDRLDESSEKKYRLNIDYMEKKYGQSNFIKRWFYLGRKMYKDDDGHWVRKTSPYQHLKYKAFLKYIRNIERNGLKIRRPYYYGGETTIGLYDCKPDYYGNIFKRIKTFFEYHFGYNYRTCWFDSSDIVNYLIISLTVKGLGQFIHGNATSRRYTGHIAWRIRRDLIKVRDMEDTEYDSADTLTSKKFGFPEKYTENLLMINRESFIKNGYRQEDCKAGVPFSVILNPNIVERLLDRNGFSDDVEFRKAILEKEEEISNYHNQWVFDNLSKKGLVKSKLIGKAYSYLGQNIDYLWD